MVPLQQSPEARLDVLRRRLYRADATDTDLQRYRDELAAALPAQPQEPAGRRSARPRRRLAGGLVLALLAGTALTVGVRLVQPPTEDPRPAAARVQQPEAADARGVLGPTPVTTSVQGTDVVGQRFQGYGDAVVLFDPPRDAFRGGRALVSLTSAEPAQVGWRALILVTARQDWASFPVVAASGSAEERTGAHTPATFVYPNRPPTRVLVQAPDDVGWTLVVGLTGRITADVG